MQEEEPWAGALRAAATGEYARALAELDAFFESEAGTALKQAGMRGGAREAFLRRAQLHQLADGDPLRAIELCEELCENDTHVFGERSIERALSLLEAAEAYQELEHPDLVRAADLTEQSATVLAGTAHEGLVFYARGSISFDRNDYAAALAALARALELLPDEQREKRAQAYNVQSLCHQELGDYGASLRDRLLEMRLVGACFGAQHPEYATSLESLADLYVDMRARAQAISITNQVIAIRHDKLGDSHSAFVDAQDDLAETQKAWAKNLTSRTALRVCFKCRKVGEALGKCKVCKQAWWCCEECRTSDKAHPAVCEEWQKMGDDLAARLVAKKKQPQQKKKGKR
jgi:tetratricopeptide (TPR) repeat protein